MNDPKLISRLRNLLANRDHSGFLSALINGLDHCAPTEVHFIQALGGDGLALFLADTGAKRSDLASRYTDLVLTQKIFVPTEVLIEFGTRIRSKKVLRLAKELASNKQENLEQCRSIPQRSLPETVNEKGAKGGPTIVVRRVVQMIHMKFGKDSASDLISMRRSVFRSEQERNFRHALTLRFPGLLALPNYPLDQIADFDKLRPVLDRKTFSYGLRCRLDAVLIVPSEGDPVAVFELDSDWHDTPEAVRNDGQKNRLLSLIGVPFFRLRAENNVSVSVDEWYAILNDQVADEITCGPRIRVRAAHSCLVPA